MKIIAFTGMPFSGKSEAVSIAQQRNYSVIRMGELVWDETKRQGLELNDQNVGYIATEMRKLHGNDIWAQHTVKKLNQYSTNKILIIDGIRNYEEIIHFKKKISSEFILVAIHSNTTIRYERAVKRGRVDDSLSLEKIKDRDNREIGWGLKKVIKTADKIITNNTSLEEFQKKINEFFDSLEKR
jgi:dephospho-CoA kinase